MESSILIYETGIDWNRDKHCDLCGWFVDGYQNHRTRLVHPNWTREEQPNWSKMDNHLERMSAEEFADYFLIDNPYHKMGLNPSRYKAITSYSKNAKRRMSWVPLTNYVYE